MTRNTVAVLILACGISYSVNAQSLMSANASPVSGSSPETTETSPQVPMFPSVPVASASQPSPGNRESLTGRWLDLTTFSHSERYRNQYGDEGYHYFEDGQQRSVLAGKIKLDESGKYQIGFRASSGRSFNWAYADYAGQGFAARLNNPAQDANFKDPASDPDEAAAYYADPAGVAFVEGVDSAGWEFYVRELYFSAHPIQPITFEFGSFGIEKGYSSEITTFDDDGYIAGERVRLNDPKHFFFDQITATSAFFGYIDQPNLFVRGGSFSKSNYRQLAVKKQLNPRVGVSGEYNWISNNARTHTLREAIVVNVNESKVLDKFRLEVYERINKVALQGDDEAPRQGFALIGEKKLGKFSGDFGVASIDRDYGVYGGSSFAQEVGFSLNGDNYNTGIRVFSHLNYKITPVITAFGFYTRITGQNIMNIDTQGLNAGVSFDLKELANTRHRVF